MGETRVGVIDHWFGNIKVAGVEVTDGQLNVGDRIRICGHTTDLFATVESMQLEHEAVLAASPGDKVGIRVPDRVRVGDDVFVVTDD
ncbi:MAG: translation elongation factor-like protein [Acidimicrobiia bacterium]|nr:translation elongation factor-like protein [Acidimicrobiia bacterium]